MTTSGSNGDNLSRDLHVRYRPCRIEELWNYPRDPVLQRLIRNTKTDRLSTVVILTGPFSSGKTTLATFLGQWTACLRWRELALPCGECETCRAVQSGTDSLRCGLQEIDCGWGGTDHAIKSIISGFSAFYTHGKGAITDVSTDNPRRRVLFLDEVQRLPNCAQDMLLKPTEKLSRGIVVMATNDKAKIDGGLQSRGTIYPLSYPTPEEAVPHLVRIAAEEGFTLQSVAAHAIARSGNGIPRDCLGLLQETMSFRQPVITMEEVVAVIGTSIEDSRER